jgi:CDP-diacylglycerol--serine O-phosphatidyltransferase
VVARLLKSVNRFGAEFDNVADLISYSVAPAFLLYLTYKRVSFISDWDPVLSTFIAGTLASLPPVFGAIRFARFNVKRIEYPTFWIGLPRPASALMIISMLNCHLFEISTIFQAAGMGVTVMISFMNISLIPYIGHHRRNFSWYLRIVLIWVALSVFFSSLGGIVFGLFPSRLVFDMVFIWMFFYVFIAWVDIPTETMEDIKKFSVEWRKEA